MEINETEKVIVKSYRTDFWTICETEEECIEKEYLEYLSIYYDLPVMGKKLVQKLISELDCHDDNAYCELGITDKVVGRLIEKIKA